MILNFQSLFVILVWNNLKGIEYIKDEEKAQRAKREEKFRKNYKNESVIYLAKAQKDNDLIPYDEVKSDFKFTHKKQEYEFTIPKEAKEEYDKMLLDEMEKEYDKVMDKPEYIGALNARKAEILKDAKSKARKTVNAKIKKDYLDGKFGEWKKRDFCGKSPLQWLWTNAIRQCSVAGRCRHCPLHCPYGVKQIFILQK